MYNLLKDRRNQLQNKRTRSRCSFNHLEALIVIAGEDENVVLKSVDCYIPSIQHWFPLRSSPLALSKHGIVAHDETLIYMTGGEGPDTMANDTLWQYNSILNEWKQLSSLQTARSELGLAIVDGSIYAVGGIYDEKRLATVERYDPSLNTWKYCAPMKLPLTNPTVSSLNGLLYVIGGTFIDEDDVVDTVQVYNPSTDHWKELSSMIMPRSGCGSCAFNDQIYVLGGFCATELSQFECYDVNLDQWKNMPSMLEARYKPGVAILNNLIYACGGRKSENIYCDSIEAFSLDNQQWSIVTFMSKARAWLSCASLRVQKPSKTVEFTL
jgi:N-acetylneuraminic acid mutarotase